jgi:hypothetical protein
MKGPICSRLLESHKLIAKEMQRRGDGVQNTSWAYGSTEVAEVV